MGPAQNNFVGFLKNNLWAIALVLASVVAQWSVFGVRLDNIEARQDRQGTAIADLQNQVTTTQTQYAALDAKVDAMNDNILYIRQRIDAAITR